MTLSFIDPRGEPGIPAVPYRLSLRSDIQRPIIGLLANSFPDSAKFASHVGKALAVAWPGSVVHEFAKPDPSVVVASEQLELVTSECDALVAIYGHCGSCTSGTVRDAVQVARAGIPAVALVTEKFWKEGDFVSMAAGMPDVPRVRLPHPVAGRDAAFMSDLATSIAPQIIALLRTAP